jgi:hypothetical protein
MTYSVAHLPVSSLLEVQNKGLRVKSLPFLHQNASISKYREMISVKYIPLSLKAKAMKVYD